MAAMQLTIRASFFLSHAQPRSASTSSSQLPAACVTMRYAWRAAIRAGKRAAPYAISNASSMATFRGKLGASSSITAWAAATSVGKGTSGSSAAMRFLTSSQFGYTTLVSRRTSSRRYGFICKDRITPTGIFVRHVGHCGFLPCASVKQGRQHVCWHGGFVRSSRCSRHTGHSNSSRRAVAALISAARNAASCAVVVSAAMW